MRADKRREQMDIAQITELLKNANAPQEAIAFVQGLKPVTSETVKDFIENNEEGKKLFNSLADQRVTKGIESFKANNLQKILDDEIAKRYPPESEEKKKLRELEQSQQALLREIRRKELTNKALQIATEKKLPVKIIDRFIGDDEESTLKNIDLLADVYSKAIEAGVSERFKEGGREPGASPGGAPPQDDSKLSDEEWFKKRVK